MKRRNGVSIKPCCQPPHYWNFVRETPDGNYYCCNKCLQEKVIVPDAHRWDWREVPYIHPHPMHQSGGDVAGFREYLGGLVKAQREYW